MDAPAQKLTSLTSLIVDFILLVIFFAFMMWVVMPHVPSHNPRMIYLWGAMGAACLTGVFWLALQMFRVVLSAQIVAGRERIERTNTPVKFDPTDVARH